MKRESNPLIDMRITVRGTLLRRLIGARGFLPVGTDFVFNFYPRRFGIEPFDGVPCLFGPPSVSD